MVAVAPDDLIQNIHDRESRVVHSPKGIQNDRPSNSAPSKPQKTSVTSRFRAPKFGRKSLLLGGVGGTAILLLGVVALIFFLLSLLKIPDLAANIIEYEGVATTRELGASVDRTVEQAGAVQAASEGTAAEGATADNPGGLIGELKQRFYDKVSSYTDKIISDEQKQLFDSLSNKLIPAKIIQNLESDHGLSYVTRAGFGGREVLQSITLDGVVYPVKQVTGIANWVPLLRGMLQSNNSADLYNGLAPAIEQSMGANVPSVIRGLVFRQLMRQWGISPWAWILSKFKSDKTSEDARLDEEQQKATQIDQTATGKDNAVTSDIADAVDEAKQAETETLADKVSLAATIAAKGIAPKVINALSKVFGNSFVKGAIDITNPVYGIVLPICLIYDGSVSRSGSTIDDNTHRQIAAFNYVEASADQQKSGNLSGADAQNLAKAVGATNEDLGDITTSIPIARPLGLPVNTLAGGSAESGASGSYYYDLYDAFGVGDLAVVNFDRAVIDHVCPILTNGLVAAGIGAANVAAAIASLGGSEVVEEGAGQTARVATEETVQNIINKIFATTVEQQGSKTIQRTFGNRLRSFLLKQILLKQGGIAFGTVALSVAAKFFVMWRASTVNSGFAQEADLADMADAGGNIAFNDINRAQLFARSLTNNEVAARDNANEKQLTYENSRLSLAERYISLDNPRSLLATAIVQIGSVLRPTFLADMVSTIGSVTFQPLSALGQVLHMTGVAYAAPDPSTQHYGNVQFGWSEDEEKLIDSNYSYLPLENQEVLSKSGKEEEIAQKYAVCFGYDYNAGGASLNPTADNSRLQLDINGQGSLGNLLANGMIQRDHSGQIVNDGDLSHCNPNNLGSDNAQYGDLVFRWRLAMQYDTTINQLVNTQTITQ